MKSAKLFVSTTTLGRNLGLVVVLMAASAVSATANEFTNGGFETGTLAGWTTTSGGFVTNTQAHTGSYSFAGFGGDDINQSFAAIDTSTITELSFWGKRDGGLFDFIKFTYSDTTTEVNFANTTGGSNDWTYINLTSYLDAGKSLTGFQIYGTSPGPAYLDDFVLETTAVPDHGATVALLGGALAGLALIRRRFVK